MVPATHYGINFVIVHLGADPNLKLSKPTTTTVISDMATAKTTIKAVSGVAATTRGGTER